MKAPVERKYLYRSMVIRAYANIHQRNLTVANHIIFLSPLLSDTLDSYHARETQAIGRAVRYGQTKEVKIWRFFTRGTIDVELFERMTDRNVIQEIDEAIDVDVIEREADSDQGTD